MKLTLSPEVRSKLGLTATATAEEVVAGLTAALAGSPRAPQASSLRLTAASDLTDDQVHDMVFGAGDIPAGLASVAKAKPPTGDGPSQTELDAFVLRFCSGR